MNWYLKRGLQALLTIFVVINLSFILIRALPGGPVAYLQSQLQQGGLTSEEAAAVAREYVNINTQAPIHEQYIEYMSQVFIHGDLGQSIHYNEPVVEVLATAAPWTVFVMVTAVIISFALGVILGSFMAYFERGRFDTVMSIYATFQQSVPYYVVAVLLLFTLSYQLGIFPEGGRFSGNVPPGFSIAFALDVLYHAALPIASIAIAWFGSWALGMRANAIRELGSDYLRVARLRGVPDQQIAARHVTPNAVLPMYTTFLLVVGIVIGGSVILEEIFTYRGLGWYMLKAINVRDFPLLMGAFTFITVIVVLALLIGDLTYAKIDPRAGQQDEEVY